MEDKVKEWIEYEYNSTKKWGDDCSVRHAIDRCYGVIMFAINSCFDKYNEELAKWWDNEMLPKFKKLEEED